MDGWIDGCGWMDGWMDGCGWMDGSSDRSWDEWTDMSLYCCCFLYRILKQLLSELVRRTVAESYPKLLLRRTESVAEKMLSSWLAFTLHGYVVVCVDHMTS